MARGKKTSHGAAAVQPVQAQSSTAEGSGSGTRLGARGKGKAKEKPQVKYMQFPPVDYELDEDSQPEPSPPPSPTEEEKREKMKRRRAARSHWVMVPDEDVPEPPPPILNSNGRPIRRTVADAAQRATAEAGTATNRTPTAATAAATAASAAASSSATASKTTATKAKPKPRAPPKPKEPKEPKEPQAPKAKAKVPARAGAPLHPPSAQDHRAPPPAPQQDAPPLEHAPPPLEHAPPPLKHAPPPLKHAPPPLKHAPPPLEHAPPLKHTAPPPPSDHRAPPPAPQQDAPPLEHAPPLKHTAPPPPSDQQHAAPPSDQQNPPPPPPPPQDPPPPPEQDPPPPEDEDDDSSSASEGEDGKRRPRVPRFNIFDNPDLIPKDDVEEGIADDDDEGDIPPPGGAPPRPKAKRGPLSNEHYALLEALAANTHAEVLKLARLTGKSFSFIWKQAGFGEYSRRAKNTYNLFQRQWSAQPGQQREGETFAEYAERCLAEYRAELAKRKTVEQKKEWRMELLRWNETYDDALADESVKAGNMFKHILTYRLESLALAQFKYRRYSIGSFGFIFPTTAGDDKARRAACMFSYSDELQQAITAKNKDLRKVIDSITSVAVAQEMSRRNPEDWTDDAAEAVISLPSQVTRRKEAGVFLKDLLIHMGLLEPADTMKKTKIQWIGTVPTLLEQEKVVKNWIVGVKHIDKTKGTLNVSKSFNAFVRWYFKWKRGEPVPVPELVPLTAVDKANKESTAAKDQDLWHKVALFTDSDGKICWTVGEQKRKDDAAARAAKAEVDAKAAEDAKVAAKAVNAANKAAADADDDNDSDAGASGGGDGDDEDEGQDEDAADPAPKASHKRRKLNTTSNRGRASSNRGQPRKTSHAHKKRALSTVHEDMDVDTNQPSSSGTARKRTHDELEADDAGDYRTGRKITGRSHSRIQEGGGVPHMQGNLQLQRWPPAPRPPSRADSHYSGFSGPSIRFDQPDAPDFFNAVQVPAPAPGSADLHVPDITPPFGIHPMPNDLSFLSNAMPSRAVSPALSAAGAAHDRAPGFASTPFSAAPSSFPSASTSFSTTSPSFPSASSSFPAAQSSFSGGSSMAQVEQNVSLSHADLERLLQLALQQGAVQAHHHPPASSSGNTSNSSGSLQFAGQAASRLPSAHAMTSRAFDLAHPSTARDGGGRSHQQYGSRQQYGSNWGGNGSESGW